VTEQLDYWSDVMSLPTFGRSVRELTVRSVATSLAAVERTDQTQIDWNRAVFVASLVTPDASEAALDGALRITQGCLQDPASEAVHKNAARVLLERLGNNRSVELAVSKDLIDESANVILSAPFELDLIKRALQFTVDLASGEAFRVNAFQQAFWESARRSDWLSVSAPTSAGKSFIVKQWLRDRLTVRSSMIAVYLVPTRALIEEVSTDLRRDLKGLAEVHTLPWDVRDAEIDRHVYVLTQERLHILQHRDRGFAADLLFIDEAQKFGDGARGVLLQRVVSEAVFRNRRAQVLFASPLTSNPEILIEGATGSAEQLTSELVTVNQNLIYAEQIPRHPLDWSLSVAVNGELVPAGTFSLQARANVDSKRLPLVAVALGGTDVGNVVYANTAAEAENMSQQIFDSLGPEADISSNEEIAALQELVVRTIHPQYALAAHLARGVAFHYGNMPLLVRQHIETLFRKNVLRYLVCTSTLLEGVNLPCKNLFVRAPRKGRGNPMTPGDFWNLAGRAGRWGVEFQGNIVCVDVTRPKVWASPPLSRTRQPITRATDSLLSNFDQLIAYCAAKAPLELSRVTVGAESLYSLVVSVVRQQRSLSELPWLGLSEAQMTALSATVSSALADVALPEDVTSRHAGISPNSMQRLYGEFLTRPNLDDLAILLPEEDESVEHLMRAMVLIDTYLGGSFGLVSGRHWQLAILIVKWMRGQPLAVLVADRVNWYKTNRPKVATARVIRDVMADVEQMARFEAPLYLACYADVLTSAMDARGVQLSQPMLPDIALMLELGVSRGTEVSLMSLGLSRTSTVALSAFIIADSLTPDECRQWLVENRVDGLNLPRLVIDEINSLTAES